ncbi:Uncharacterized protein BWINRASL_02956 [Bacillus mycoides]|nr:hypothetical protein IEQ_02647 [Bacillus cereus BAG6X1-2]SCM95590.1 Uncharacterized protein BWINRASL_02956 [Bacillus mycoides]
MKKFSRTGKILLGFGAIQVFWGLVMLNVINGIDLFEHTSNMVKYSILITGIVCCVASNFFKKPKNCTN